MDAGFINLTPENLDGEHLCCIIRSKKAHPGVEAKRQWLADRCWETAITISTVCGSAGKARAKATDGH